MNHQIFTVAEKRPVRAGMTISRGALQGRLCSATYFSLGEGTSISRERYDNPALYLGDEGRAVFSLGEDGRKVTLEKGELLAVPGGTLCGAVSEGGAVYTEIIIKEDADMNSLVKSGEIMMLKDLIPYEEESISNLDIVSGETVKFVLMAFDKGTGLQPHRAPGNAIVFALEGEAVIGYEGKEYPISAGECFRFDKEGLHSVNARERFKMALLLVLE